MYPPYPYFMPPNMGGGDDTMVKAFKLYERILRKEERKRLKKETEEKLKKPPEIKKLFNRQFNILEVFALLCMFSLPVFLLETFLLKSVIGVIQNIPK